MKFTALVATTAAVAATAVSTNTAVAQDTVFQPEIFGGSEVPVGSKSYLAGLRVAAGSHSYCGGSLVTPTHIITAAHCSAYTAKYVSIGSHYANGTRDGEYIAVKRQIVHPKFNETTMTHDTMILELTKPSKITPVKLMDASLTLATGDKTTVAGWGLMPNGSYSDVLLKVDVKIADQKTCQAAYLKANPDDKLDDTMVCAGGEAGKDACTGDSGGPLTVSRNGEDVLVAVVSWGEAVCGTAGLPGVYGRLSTSLDFIYQTIPSLKPATPTPKPTTTAPTPKPTTKAPTPKPTTKKP